MPNYCKSLYDKYQADKTTLQTVPVPDQPTVPGDDVENPGNGDDNRQTEVPAEARTEAPTRHLRMPCRRTITADASLSF